MDLHDTLTEDHGRLDELLAAAIRDPETIDEGAWAEFRRGLLRHIGIEERVLFPLVRKIAGATEFERRLHRDHAALAALLVPPPRRDDIAQIRAILDEHNPIEESPGGFYDFVEQLPGLDRDTMMERVRAYAEVQTAPYTDSELLRRTIERLLRARRES